MRKATTFTEAREAAKAFQGKPLTNARTGMVAVVSRKSLDKMLSESAVCKSESPTVHSAAVANADKLFEQAVYGWSKPDRDGSSNITAIHRLFALVKMGGLMKIVKLTVKASPQSTHADQLYTVEAVEFGEGDKGFEWIEASARADGVNLEKIPNGGARARKCGHGCRH